ncbi:surfeit locus protein 2-like [Diadema antillarum]|uniref:surfeit locus protein 2-like n=1 Tax=Diadema antillarum TaxID=105358 RepID=UPI003A83D1BF
MEDGRVPKDVLDFISRFPSLSIKSDIKKVHCSLTGHEMPCRIDDVRRYTGGKKYRHAQERSEDHFEKYKPHIIPSNKKGRGHQLFCTLTLRHINRTAEHIERNVNGRRYQKALLKYEECQRLGIKFKPLTRRKQQEGDSDEEGKRKYSKTADSESSESEAESEDSLSDLYPREEFERLEEDEMGEEDSDDSNFDIENMECDVQDVNGASASSTSQGGIKRKKSLQKGTMKKALKMHHRPRIPIQKAFANKRRLKQPRKENR